MVNKPIENSAAEIVYDCSITDKDSYILLTDSDVDLKVNRVSTDERKAVSPTVVCFVPPATPPRPPPPPPIPLPPPPIPNHTHTN